MSTTLVAPTAKAGPRQWLGLALLLLPMMMLTVSLGVQLLALPRLSTDLGTTPSQLLWITDIYSFVMAGFLVTMGTLGDRIGRRRMLLLGSALFAAASTAAAYAVSPELLIGARALAGLAGALLMPATLALISNMFTDARQRALAIAMWATALAVGFGLGPLLGGVLLAHFWWGSAFLAPVPVMLLVVAAGRAVLPEYRAPEPARMDLPSVGLFLGAVLPVVYGVKHLAETGPDVTVWASVLLGLALGRTFIRRQRTLTDPLLDIGLFRDRAFSGALLLLLFGLMAMHGVTFLAPQFFQQVGGLSTVTAGLLMLPSAVGNVLGAQLTPVLARRFPPGTVVAGGAALAAAGFALIALAGASDLAAVVTGLTVLFLGLTPIIVLGTDLIVGAAPPHKAGSASAVGSTTLDLGVSLGIALVGSAATAAYRGRMDGAVPAGVPAEAAGAARESIGGAVTAAGRLGDGSAAGAQLLASARGAFTEALNLAGTIGGVLALAITGLALAALRHVRPRGGGE